ncbi:hypothetical protein H0G86_008397 [Trichoderma simmonsii]|uniref:Uncharacterized protein n=1 Tax=Trichoderma simmonsii TaxID=1491479 RepID=A0A8G0LIG8_9HYPO|nr:hypothetical protein H0G86_008397 [Trichoderma simmonsii]
MHLGTGLPPKCSVRRYAPPSVALLAPNLLNSDMRRKKSVSAGASIIRFVDELGLASSFDVAIKSKKDPHAMPFNDHHYAEKAVLHYYLQVAVGSISFSS